MDRTRPEPRVLTLEEIEDAHDLRAVIAAALAASPPDQESLRRGVWTYVRSERDMGTPPAAVIVALTSLVDLSTVGPPAVRQSITRQIILWCVESYFGYLGGEMIGGAEPRPVTSVATKPRIVSNR